MRSFFVRQESSQGGLFNGWNSDNVVEDVERMVENMVMPSGGHDDGSDRREWPKRWSEPIQPAGADGSPGINPEAAASEAER